MKTVTGVILAGGKSQRMGRDKLFLKTGGVSLFERVYRVLNPIFDDLIVIANTANQLPSYDVRVYPDLIPNRGALGGLYTGLKYASKESVFCFAADMPFLNSRLIRYMMEKDTEAQVIIPETPDGLQPLHAIYAKTCLKPIEHLISKSNLKIVDFLMEVNVIYVSEGEILKYDPTLKSFLNINTEEDLRRAEAMLIRDIGGDDR